MFKLMQIARGGHLWLSKYSAVPVKRLACSCEARNVVRRGASNAALAASLPSPSACASPKRKKVSKNERRTLIQSFVTRYRSLNAGKFPSASLAQKEVGGSYYFVRKILQELEYQSKLCASDSSYEITSGKLFSKEDKSFSEVDVVSTVVRVQDDTCIGGDDIMILDTNDRQLEAGGVLQDYTLGEESSSTGVLKPPAPGSDCDSVLEEKCHAKSLEKQEDDIVKDANIDSSDIFQTVPYKENIASASHEHHESEELSKAESKGIQSTFGVVKDETKTRNEGGDKMDQMVSTELLNADSPDLKDEHQQQLAEEKEYARNLASQETNNTEGSKKSTLWQSLKTFADGIFHLWRKR